QYREEGFAVFNQYGFFFGGGTRGLISALRRLMFCFGFAVGQFGSIAAVNAGELLLNGSKLFLARARQYQHVVQPNEAGNEYRQRQDQGEIDIHGLSLSDTAVTSAPCLMNDRNAAVQGATSHIRISYRVSTQQKTPLEEFPHCPPASCVSSLLFVFPTIFSYGLHHRHNI